MYARILIGVDGSEVGRAALSRGLELAERDGSSVTLLHAFDEPVAIWADPASLPHRAGMYEDAEAFGRALLDEAAQVAGARGLVATTTLARNVEPLDALLQACAGHDLLVVGSHGRRGFERLVMGSVAEGVARRAPCDVLIVKPGKPAQRA